MAAEQLARAREIVRRAGTAAIAAHLALTEAFCALCRGDLAAAARLLEARLAADGGVGALGEALGVAPLLVEAWTGLSRVAEAARRAEDELRATGRTARPRRPLPEEPLTAQETRIAGLGAQGHSNAEIAAALFLGTKTVEHHLSGVYRKRGLRSRIGLARPRPPGP